MTAPALSILVLALTMGPLWACSPAPAHAPTPAAAVNRTAPPAPPPKMMRMICRNSQDGRKVECGTPNAVMVGMEPM